MILTAPSASRTTAEHVQPIKRAFLRFAILRCRSARGMALLVAADGGRSIKAEPEDLVALVDFMEDDSQ